MSRLSFRPRRVLPVAVLALVAGLAPGGAAEAAPVKCTITGYTPGEFVLAGTKLARNFDVSTSSGCQDGTWKIAFDGTPILNAANGLVALSVDPSRITNAAAGRVTITVSAKSKTSGAARGTKDFAFYLQRRSTWGPTFNVSPEPARAGATLAVTGRLKRISWKPSPSYVGYADRTVAVQFKAAGAKKFVTVKKTMTGADGEVATTVKARKSGTWRLRYAGNTKTGAANSKGDVVTVTR